MLDYEVQRCSRRCSVTDRELRSGETCYSALVPAGGEVVRQDFSAEAWKGPPASAIGWWKATVVDPNDGRLHWAPNDVMLHYFERLLEDPAGLDARYVLGLLLVRRRIARLERTETAADGTVELVLYCPRNDREYRVSEATVTPERAAAIQQQLSDLLQTHGAMPT